MTAPARATHSASACGSASERPSDGRSLLRISAWSMTMRSRATPSRARNRSSTSNQDPASSGTLGAATARAAHARRPRLPAQAASESSLAAAFRRRARPADARAPPSARKRNQHDGREVKDPRSTITRCARRGSEYRKGSRLQSGMCSCRGQQRRTDRGLGRPDQFRRAAGIKTEALPGRVTSIQGSRGVLLLSGTLRGPSRHRNDRREGGSPGCRDRPTDDVFRNALPLSGGRATRAMESVDLISIAANTAKKPNAGPMYGNGVARRRRRRSNRRRCPPLVRLLPISPRRNCA